MVKRLTELVERNCVIRHRYDFVYSNRNYGFLFDLKYEHTANYHRVYYLLNYSNNTTRTRLGLHFMKHRPSENLEDKLIERNLTPLTEITTKILNSIDNDKLSPQEVQKVMIDLITYFVIIHTKRLEIDFELVQKGINFTRRFCYDTEVIRSVINYFSKFSTSIFDIIIRIMTDPMPSFLKAPKE